MAEQSVSLQPSESTPVAFEAIPHEAKTYQVSVNGLTGSFIAAPLYKASISFRRERRCMTSRGDECLEYYPYEREGTVTVTNKGAPGQFMTTMQGYTHWAADYHEHKRCELLGDITSGQWTDYFATGQVKTYRFYYIVGSTGMPIDSRFFIKVKDPDGKIIAEEDYILPL